MTVNRRTTTVLAIIAFVLVVVFVTTQWQRSVATRKLLSDLPGDDYAKVKDAMTQLPDRRHTIVPALLQNLHSPSDQARWRSVILLGEVGNRAAWGPLSGALGDPSPYVRAAAALALGKLHVKSSAPGLRLHLSDEKEQVGVRIAAARGLGLLRDAASVEALQAALRQRRIGFEAVAGTTWQALADAKTALKTARETAAKPPVLPATAPGEKPLTLAQQEEAKKKKQVELDQAVTDADKALGEAKTKFATANADFLAAGGKALSEPPEPLPTPPPGAPAAPAAPALKPPNKEDPAWELRQACATALGQVGDAKGVKALGESADAHQEANAEVRTAAAYALGDVARHSVQDPAASDVIQVLLAATKDKIADVRAAAVFSLGFATVPTTLEPTVASALTKLLDDDSYWTREATRKTMKALNMAAPVS